MWLSIIGAILNTIGGISCGLISYFSFRFGRLDDWRFFLLSFGTILLSIAFFSYSILFSLNVIPHLDSIHAPIGDARDHSYLTVTHQMSLWWMFTSLLMLGGYVLLAVGYTVRTFKKPSLALFFPSLATIANIELAGVFLVSYLLFLVTFNVMKAGKRRESLAVLTYFVLLSSQLLTTWGLLTKALTSFLLGVTIRGITFFPSLLVFLTSGKE